MRSTPEWIGANDDVAVPQRVRLRVLYRFELKCAHCKRFILPGVRWVCDHIIALINGGENRENNLQPLCGWCAPKKDAEDVAEKSATYASRSRHLGVAKSKHPMPCGRNSPYKKTMSGMVVRRERT